MKVILLRHTPEPENTVALAAKLCYSSSSITELEDETGDGSNQKFLTKILSLGHLSVLEHASFTFGIEGISRANSHQLVRHRLASYSQQSQRYVKADTKLVKVVTPHTINDNAEAKKLFDDFTKDAYATYGKLTELGIPKEDARYVLPNAAETKIIVTMNARELIHFFLLRCCERAQWEIREMATEMLSLAKIIAPFIFKDAGPGCVAGSCAEGEMTCGKPKETREKFKNL
ncbi:MAG: FAD-dependent thymidylate synthase [Deltaproteobacteria bacterium]|nr:FAD-dependent thymidylate synthase [Deltaproteobacteria bacterium]